jgi:ubiquinone/menaquinone biosynthesis C-methylase UbiE
MQDDIERLRRAWTRLGADDPLWAILSQPGMRGGRWDEADFFALGESEIAALEAQCAALGLPDARGRALDFGCGVGRLSRALASRYGEVVGVDISTTMLARARQLHAAMGNVRFVENRAAHLAFLHDVSVDLVYSTITLHHIPATLQLTYIDEFLRVLTRGGLAVFQIACGYTRDWRGTLYRLVPNTALAPLRRLVHGSRAAADLHVIDEAAVRDLIQRRGKRVLQALDVDAAGAGLRGRMLFVGA